jgi:hypothetical protein
MSGGCCELCGREVSELTRHHLIPQTRHKNKKNKKRFARSEVRSRIAWLCRPCHSNVHCSIGIKELERHYDQLETLAAHPAVACFTAWIRSKPPGFRPQFRNAKHDGASDAGSVP